MSEDYYKLLGVQKKANDDEIKKAYRKSAMKYHPDKTKGDKNAEDRFKKISEAYAVLSDKKKRQEYDTFGAAGFRQRFSQDDIFRGVDLSSIIKEFGMGGAGQGGSFKFNFGQQNSFGSGFGRRPQKGADLVYELPLTLQEIATGTTRIIQLKGADHSEAVNIKIPKGMTSGKKLRITDKGNVGMHGGPCGDLYIKIQIQNDPVFKVDGYDLHTNQEIKLTQAILGVSIPIKTIEDRELMLKIPPGTRHKTKMKMPGCGLPYAQNGPKGNLFVCINVKMPSSLSDEQKKLIEKLSETGI